MTTPKNLGLFECDCDCHRNPNVKHVVSCCYECPKCRKQIKTCALALHIERCQDSANVEDMGRIATFLSGSPIHLSELLARYREIRAKLDEHEVNELTFCHGLTDQAMCQELATVRVEWSDRSMPVCDAHLDYARKCAANDSSSDRTTNPRIENYFPSEQAVENWHRLRDRWVHTICGVMRKEEWEERIR